MSGVIDNNGQQWEHCCLCNSFHKIQNLGYLPPTDKFPQGIDIGLCCIATLTQEEIEALQPGANWTPVYG